MVIAICKILKMISTPEAANSLIVRVDHELEFWVALLECKEEAGDV